ncbi:MAG: twin-arginine translocation signal domain-containing protein [Planctomycetaceae bacterium]|nr:twin-arginine translocation signal domain-containing protein [Planctomycetaceae bacterium]
MKKTRRSFLGTSAAVTASLITGRSPADPQATAFPTRFITRGPRHHWFGYYDKFQFDVTGRYVLGMQVPFEHRSPQPDDVVEVGMVDLQDGDRWISLGQSSAWNWQQGCMLQWLPGSESTVVWNDREGDRFVCRVLDVKTDRSRTIPFPVYSISPDGRTAVTPDFRRIADVRPGYGYAGLPDPFADDPAPAESGIFRVDMKSGDAKLILSLKQIAAVGEIPDAEPGIKHYFNHLLLSPSGHRFIALHRWRYPDGRRLTRMITAALDGSDIRIVIPNGYASHFIWRDDDHILSQSRNLLGNSNWGDFLFQDRTDGILEEVGHGVLDPSGHLTYLPGNNWILNDTYPKGSERLQTPHLYHIASGRRIDLGSFHLPPQYTGEWRVDTHPRQSRNGRMVCIDAVNGDEGRQLCLIDISSVFPEQK